MASIPTAERIALTERIERFLSVYYAPEDAARVRFSFRGASASIDVDRGESLVKAGLLRWTGDPSRWGFGKWEGTRYSHFWVGGQEFMEPEWGVAMAAHYVGVNPRDVPCQYNYLSGTDVERWVRALPLPVTAS